MASPRCLSVDRPINLPEVRWTYRRGFTYARSIVYSILLVMIIARLPTAAASAAKPLQWIALAILAAKVIDGLSYLQGATATDIARITAAARSGQAPPGDPS